MKLSLYYYSILGDRRYEGYIVARSEIVVIHRLNEIGLRYNKEIDTITCLDNEIVIHVNDISIRTPIISYAVERILT